MTTKNASGLGQMSANSFFMTNLFFIKGFLLSLKHFMVNDTAGEWFMEGGRDSNRKPTKPPA